MGDDVLRVGADVYVEEAIQASGYSEADKAELRRIAAGGKAAGETAAMIFTAASLGASAKLARPVEALRPTVYSPNSQMRTNANARGTYIDPLTGREVAATGKLAADHVIPKDWIKQQPGFDKLTSAQQDWILNHPLNTQGLPKTFNSSKGAVMPDEWMTYKGQPLAPGYIGDQQLRADFLRGWVQQQINQFNAGNGK